MRDGEEPAATDRDRRPSSAPPGARWYWAERIDLSTGRAWIDPEEVRHLRAVRHRRADPIEVIDGRGGRFTVALSSGLPAPGRRAAPSLEARILAAHPPIPAPSPLALATPCIKWPRLEALIDGAVQLGATHVLLWTAERAIPVELTPPRSARLERIARAATTQSLGTHAPAIAGPFSLPALCSALAALVPWSSIWVAHGPQAETGDRAPARALPAPDGSRPSALVIGPEGGLTAAEVGAFAAEGAQILDLGARRLRTEVAAVAGLAALRERSRAEGERSPHPSR